MDILASEQPDMWQRALTASAEARYCLTCGSTKKGNATTHWTSSCNARKRPGPPNGVTQDYPKRTQTTPHTTKGDKGAGKKNKQKQEEEA